MLKGRRLIECMGGPCDGRTILDDESGRGFYKPTGIIDGEYCQVYAVGRDKMVYVWDGLDYGLWCDLDIKCWIGE